MNQKLKMTEVGWIPKDWEVKTIAQCTDVVTGATPSTAITSYWGGNIKWMNSGELNNKLITDVAGRITEDGYNHSGTHMVPENCVLIGLAGQGKTRGTAAYNLIPLCTNQSIASILPNEKEFHSLYLFHYIDSQYDALRLLSAGDGGRGGLNKQIILSLQFPLPPTSEQRRIAQVLSDTDSLIAFLSRTIKKKRLVKQGTMQELLTGNTRLKGFCEEWVEMELREVCQITMGQSPDSRYYNTSKQGLPLIQGNADIEKRKSIDRIYTTQITKTCDTGDIIMSVRAPVGAVGIATRTSCIGRGACAMKCRNRFVYQWLMYQEDKWSSLSTGSTFDSINSDTLNKVRLMIPIDENEQIAIANILTTMDDEIAALEAERDKYISIKQGMMQKLLTGEIRLPICQTTE